MPEHEKPKRKSSRSYRPPKDLEAELDRRVSLSGLTFNAFITEAWHGRSRHRPDENLKLARLLSQSAAIADRQRDHRFAETEETRLLQKAILAELILIRNAIMARLGRRS